MSNVTIIGAQWGDEGKGKVVDWLASRADIVVRFQGGHNAGHTLVVGNETYKLSLLPSGLVRGKLGIIGNGVVIDPVALLAEIDRVTAQGLNVTPETLRIADNAPLILPLHAALDSAREAARGDRRIGTTGRGIGPAYEDKVARRAIRVADLAEPETLSAKLDELLLHHNTLLAGLGAPIFSKDKLLASLLDLAPKLLPFAEPVWERLSAARRAGQRILFEGAQAVMLDVDHGTYRSSPLPTPSPAPPHPAAGSVRTRSAASSVSPKPIAPASAPAPSLPNWTMRRVACSANAAMNSGTVTGRKRRCGWFDAALVRQAVKVGGINGLALTKLDVLDGFAELKIGVGFSINGQTYKHLPAGVAAQAAAIPIYETMKGWNGSTRGARSWADLPSPAIKYVKRIEELVEAPVTLLSTSPERDDTILMQDPFAD